MAEEKYFLVEVTETLQRTVKVKAETSGDAERIAMQARKECMVVLDAENLTDVSYSTTETAEDNNDSYYNAALVEYDDGNVYWETNDKLNEHIDEDGFCDYDYESTEPVRGCKDCPPDECTGHCMSCWYRPV